MAKAKTIKRVSIKDVNGDFPGKSRVEISREKGKLAIIIHPDGYGTLDGDYGPILLERHEGQIRLVVWGDINKEDPTHTICLDGAMEARRKPVCERCGAVMESSEASIAEDNGETVCPKCAKKGDTDVS